MLQPLFKLVALLVFALPVFAQAQTVVPFMSRAEQPIAVDGSLDEWGFTFGVTMNKATEPDGGRTESNFPVDDDDDLSGVIHLMWDDDNLYVAAVVKDDVPGVRTPGASWLSDGVEIYLSNVETAPDALHGDDHGGTFYDEGDGSYEVQLFIRYSANGDSTDLLVFVPADIGLIDANDENGDVYIHGSLNDDEDGYVVEGRIAWSALQSLTTGNLFEFDGGERVPAQFSLIDVDEEPVNETYGGLQLVAIDSLGPNLNPGGAIWEVLDVRAGAPAAAEDDTLYTYMNEPYAMQPAGEVTIDGADTGEWAFTFPITMNKATEPDGGRTEANFPVADDDDLSGTIRVMYDEFNLYFFAEVLDNVPGQRTPGASWLSDGVEIYLSNVPIEGGALWGEDHGATFFDEGDGSYEVQLFMRYDAADDSTDLLVFVPADVGIIDSNDPEGDVYIKGALNDDENGYRLEGRILWEALTSPTTGNGFEIQLGKTALEGSRLPAQFSLIDVDEEPYNETYGGLQILKHPGFGPNGNPGGRLWNSLDLLGKSFQAVKGVTTSVERISDIPKSFALEQNYPNPFNPSTQIRFSLTQAAGVSLAIYDVTGRLVRTVLEGATLTAGTHSASVDMADLPSGVYMYTLSTGVEVQTRAMILAK